MDHDSPIAHGDDGPRAGARAPAGSRVYAVGDIHGRADLLHELRAMILDDAGDGAGLRKVVVYLGDYIDRGRDSRGVVQILVEAPLPGFEEVHLMGNHDAWMLDCLEGEELDLSWMLNGGPATLESYRVTPPADLTLEGLEAARRDLGEKVPGAHREFFKALKLSHVEGDYLFVHAGIRPGVPLARQQRDDLLWIREEFLSSGLDHGKIVVHGHSPAHQVQVEPNRIGIDTWAFATSQLTCLVLEGAERRFLQT
jgi:serine/threonine protein phosphatase 1